MRLHEKLLSALICVLVCAQNAIAHEHHTDQIPDGAYISPDPIDTILLLHIMFMIMAFGVLFPTGMVLGITRSRWHVPTQVAATALAVVGYFLGHKHKGRQFGFNVHSTFAGPVMLFLIAQIAIGVYLRFHLVRGFQGRIRGWIIGIHGIIGKMFPIMSWVQMGFGAIALLGFCHEDHLGQCLAHGIMGSSFVGYGVINAILLVLGQQWLKRQNKSQDFYDSVVITLWGLVNTFTEHRFGQAWSHKDLQHTSMGIVWWCGGLVGTLLSLRKGRPQRTVIPAIIIILTGWAMAGHAQSLMISTMMHGVFGHTLMVAGATRIVEIAMILGDKPNCGEEDEVRSFQYIPPFLLIASGMLFMCSNEEQLIWLDSIGVDHVSYALTVFSIAFIIYFLTLFLIKIYQNSGHNAELTVFKDHEALSHPNGTNGFSLDQVARDALSDRRARNVTDFELEELLDEDDEDDTQEHSKKHEGDM